MSPMHGSGDTLIWAPAQDVYELVSDITRMGEWSPLCHRCEWLDAEKRATVVGARFIGHNRQGDREWSTTCEVIAAEPGREFAFATLIPDSQEPLWRTAWRYSLRAEGDATRLTESFDVVNPPVYAQNMSDAERTARRADVIENVRATLERIKWAAEK